MLFWSFFLGILESIIFNAFNIFVLALGFVFSLINWLSLFIDVQFIIQYSVLRIEFRVIIQFCNLISINFRILNKQNTWLLFQSLKITHYYVVIFIISTEEYAWKRTQLRLSKSWSATWCKPKRIKSIVVVK